MFKILLVATIFIFSDVGCHETRTNLDTNNIENNYLKKMYIGLYAGIYNPTNDLSSSEEIGISLGFQPDMAFGLGLDVNSTPLKNTGHFERTSVLAQTAYKIGGDVLLIRNTCLGISAGTVFVNNSVSYEISPFIGFDYPLSNKATDVISLGITAKYEAITSYSDAYVGNIVIKYWY